MEGIEELLRAIPSIPSIPYIFFLKITCFSKKDDNPNITLPPRGRIGGVAKL